MESPEEVVAFCSSSSSNGGGGDGANDCQYNSTTSSTFTKRKRTKRLRAFSSPPPAPAPPPPVEEDYFSTTTLTTTTTTKEEEDTAHCLILLAQGRGRAFGDEAEKVGKFSSRKFAEAATTATGAKAGFYVYECKTCSKCFPSFQALGGHRASHKKPKLQPNPTPEASASAAAAINKDNIDHHVVDNNYFSNNIKFRVHECSICGSEFSSGQALGGHMRRHRPPGTPSAAATAPEPSPEPTKRLITEEEEKKSVVLLSLDLNLPAPSEETKEIVAFAFSDQRPMPLVDCHY